MRFFEKIYFIQLIYADRFGVGKRWAWIFASMITGIIFIWVIKIFFNSLSLLGFESYWHFGTFLTMAIGSILGFLFFSFGERYIKVAEKFEYISEDELKKIEKESFSIILVITIANILL